MHWVLTMQGMDTSLCLEILAALLKANRKDNIHL